MRNCNSFDKISCNGSYGGKGGEGDFFVSNARDRLPLCGEWRQSINGVK